MDDAGARDGATPAASGPWGWDGPFEPDLLDDDALDELADTIARAAAHLHAGREAFLRLIALFEATGAWEARGHRSCAHWLAYRTGLDLITAREHVRVARALDELPETRAAMARGALSFSQARAVTRVAEPETEERLLELAEGCTAATLERVVRAWRKGSRRDEAALERERHRSRRLTVVPDDDGMYLIRGRLEPEVGAVLMRGIEAAEDTLYRRERSASTATGPDDYRDDSAETSSGRRRRIETSRRRADAIGLLAERALAAGFGDAEMEDGSGDESPDASNGVPVSGSRAERYQAFLHVDAATLSRRGEPGRSELEDGTRVSAETSRRLACDVAVVRVARDEDGSVLDVGRRSRTVPPALRRALDVRDRGCRFPGCGLRFCDAHHLVHWADGGETSLDNTLLLCRRHHRLVHEEGWRVEWWGKGRPAFHDPRGRVHLDAGWQAPPLGADPVATLVRENRERGVEPGPLAAGARWRRERDVPDSSFFGAVEAVVAAAPP